MLVSLSLCCFLLPILFCLILPGVQSFLLGQGRWPPTARATERRSQASSPFASSPLRSPRATQAGFPWSGRGAWELSSSSDGENGGAGSQSFRLAVIGEEGTADVARALATQCDARVTTLADLLQRKNLSATAAAEDVCATVIEWAKESTKSWVIEGFPTSAYQAELLEDAGVLLDRLVLIYSLGDDFQDFAMDEEDGMVDLMDESGQFDVDEEEEDEEDFESSVNISDEDGQLVDLIEMYEDKLVECLFEDDAEVVANTIMGIITYNETGED